MSSRADPPPVPATLWRRLVAAAVDAVPVLVLGAILAALVIGLDPDPTEIPPWNPLDRVVDYLHLETARFVVIALGTVALSVALTTVQVTRLGGTIGMRLTGLSASPLGDTSPTAGTLRVALWASLGLLLTAFGGLTLWWGFAAPSRRTLHDRLAGLGLQQA